MKKVSEKATVSALKDWGFKITGPRKAILDFFSRHSKPVNAEGLFQGLKTRRIDQATIYRNLASLEGAGIIKKVDLQKSSAYYELAEGTAERAHHHHIVCTACGSIEDFEFCDFREVSEHALRGSRMFTSVDRHSLELFGICRKCQ